MQIIKKTLYFITLFIISIVVIIVKLYQLILSPILGSSCRYMPTCSQYMLDSVKLHGLYGVLLGVKRIIRCNPLYESKYDPVPKKKSSLTLKE